MQEDFSQVDTKANLETKENDGNAEEKDDEIVEDDLLGVDQQIAELQEEEYREQKRKKKKVLKERKKLNERLNLKMILKNDDGPTLEADDMFSLRQVADNNKMQRIVDQTPDVLIESDEDDGLTLMPKYARYEKDKGHLDSGGTYYKDSESELEMETDEELDEETFTKGLGNQNLIN